MQLILTDRIKTHIVSGFLGAGKTTFLTHLLQQKPKHERWAVLINEFGQIGIDQVLLSEQSDIHIQELLGGCLCCSSQLPMQLALSQLIKTLKPDRLFIEPTGLGHVQQLVQQLTQPVWQNVLDLRAVLCVVNASQIQQLHEQELFQAQLTAANIVFLSHLDLASDADQLLIQQLTQSYVGHISAWLRLPLAQIQIEMIDQAVVLKQISRQPLLSQQMHSFVSKPTPKSDAATHQAIAASSQTAKSSKTASTTSIQQLPYFYTQEAQGYAIRGWRFSRRWQFDLNLLLQLLQSLQHCCRIKAIVHSDQGWISLNLTFAQGLDMAEQVQTIRPQVDSRIEVIDQEGVATDWIAFEAELLSSRIQSE